MRQGVFSSEECAAQEGVNEWLAEAKSEDECVGEDSGRYVCYLPGMRFTLGFFYNKEDCECLGGKYKSSTVWEMGVWKEPKFIPFVWNEEQQRAHYEWVDALSFEKIAGWVVDSVEERATAITVSSLTCERNFTSSSLDWIVCNCLSNSTNDECLVSPAPRVATGRVCAGLPTNISAPSSYFVFREESISDGCVGIELGFHSFDGFTYLRKRPSITVQFEKPRNSGLVVNQKGATVGSLLGDGIEITFLFEDFHTKGIEVVEEFEVCLNQHFRDGGGNGATEWENRTSLDLSSENDGLNEGEIGDFAILQDDGTLRVLYMDVRRQGFSGYLYYCGVVHDVEWLLAEGSGSSFSLFPVARLDEANDQEVHSDQARILAYVLCGFFLALLLFYLGLFVKNSLMFRTVLGLVVPILFVLLCVFRAVFFLLWAQGEFNENEVAEYIVFETPTFLLLALLLLLISCWKSISTEKARPNSNPNHTREIILLILVLLLYIAIVVASIVINETIGVEESDCPGRAPADNSELEDAFSTLSIVYMSVVTFFTFLFAGVLFFEAKEILRMISKGFLLAIIYIPTSRFTFVFLIFFLVRCILFLILYAADITSDIFVFVLLMVCEVVPCMILWLEIFLVFFSSSQTATGSVSALGSSRRESRVMNLQKNSRKELTPVPVSSQSQSLSQVF